MYLSHLHIRYFRSLYDVTLELKPLTIFIGPNASGKSNVFKALRFLHDAVAGDRLEWQAYDSQIDDLVWYGLDELGNRPEIIKFDCGFDTLQGQRLGTYQTVFHCAEYITVDSEQLKIALSADSLNLSTFLHREHESVSLHIGKRGKPLKRPNRLKAPSVRTLMLREEGPDLKVDSARSIYEHIRGWRFYDVIPAKARQASFIPQYPEEVPPLANDASNLSAFLYALWRLQPDDFDMIAEYLSDMVGFPQSLIVEHDAERGGRNAHYALIEWPFGEERPVPPESLSDGTVRLLAYLALLLGDQSVSLACLEEPDRGLHPRLMLHLADILRQAVTPTPEEENKGVLAPQVLVATHSPEFLDCFDLREEQDYLQVYIVERDAAGKTVFKPATAKEFIPWLEKYRLGEAVRRRFIS
ncbi:MAG TPA: DUF2813 domain-containing protein [Candidatus Tenderia sp.]|nr:DUF2813 domain-containing protein [Candidatus Tenderia sp.]